MREIDNNNKINGLNFKSVKAEPAATAEIHEPAATEIAKEIKDLGNVPEASLGKSQISADSIEADMKFFEKNPKLTAALNGAIDKYAKNRSGEDTLKFIQKIHHEFSRIR